jgi:hypothetical protein
MVVPLLNKTLCYISYYYHCIAAIAYTVAGLGAAGNIRIAHSRVHIFLTEKIARLEFEPRTFWNCTRSSNH